MFETKLKTADMLRKTIVLLGLLLAAAPALALGPRVDWGVLAGINVPEYSTSMSQAEIKNKLGWQAGITASLGLGSWSIDPQILYVRQGIKLDPTGLSTLSLRSNSIDVPVLVNKRLLRIIRIYAGPVFTVLNNCKLSGGTTAFDFGRLRPTMAYAVGANVRLLGHLLVDLRYNGQFKSKHDVVLPDGSELAKLRTYNVALSVGYIF